MVPVGYALTFLALALLTFAVAAIHLYRVARNLRAIAKAEGTYERPGDGATTEAGRLELQSYRRKAWLKSIGADPNVVESVHMSVLDDSDKRAKMIAAGAKRRAALEAELEQRKAALRFERTGKGDAELAAELDGDLPS